MMRYLIVLLLFTGAANAQTAVVRIDFPPMPIHRVKPGLLLTANEPCTGTITLDTGEVLKIKTDSIPPTWVRGIGLRKMVDACVASGAIEGGGTIVVYLPPEPVVVRLRGIVAKAIDCQTVVTLKDGTVLRGSIHSPDCPTLRIGRGSFLATAVTYYGSVKK